MPADDLTVQLVQPVLDQLPAPDPTEIADIMLGCGLLGENWATSRPHRSGAVGLDTVPGTTVTRDCVSSVETTRMAMHAIKAGPTGTAIRWPSQPTTGTAGCVGVC